ncbi:branched-chain amino acid ABC transporter permease [Shimia thalassica]|jgi:branched-chain amino acid transport system permease protein|uniref:LIV-I protein H n=1 Tax=Shimia thalassica TaxID=1715693 RepID=A0A0P1I791_9RHOB|nr:branched-chain amino acid ABC transporter permease [Shimia thalassica]PHO03979.1 branched-chain amino acid ABC transporter permease [Rhodobacteraceae bacterium 4F10]MDO6478019.1 branched-chain amino acid ABC transporter permease [Shimia thalassica]MDO6485201.1 branched-chain amino acid ABC transporter permease [Shimia thalassica]MDP2494117.1 branched-chain amino acid ABC transporter permease [Shimia thalassica]MDP2518922.1 branched-chain amino acid ABC transporter permease [Shimia thalassic
MLTAIAIAVDGLGFAAWLFLSSVGLTLIYGVMRILNIAHGGFYALGAYSSAWAIGLYTATGSPVAFSFLLIPLAALIAGGIAGLLVERGILKFMYGRDEVLMVLVTYAVFLILEDVTKLIWGTESYIAWQPAFHFGTVEIVGIPYTVYKFLIIGTALLVGLSLFLVLNKTRVGKLLLVVIEDREISSALGINVTLFFSVTFVVGAILGALGGAITAPEISVSPGIGAEIIVLSFAVIVIGGMGSIGGAMIGAVIVGFARAASVHLYPPAELFSIYLVMAAVLAVKPYGLFALAESRKI